MMNSIFTLPRENTFSFVVLQINIIFEFIFFFENSFKFLFKDLKLWPSQTLTSKLNELNFFLSSLIYLHFQYYPE